MLNEFLFKDFDLEKLFNILAKSGNKDGVRILLSSSELAREFLLSKWSECLSECILKNVSPAKYNTNIESVLGVFFVPEWGLYKNENVVLEYFNTILDLLNAQKKVNPDQTTYQFLVLLNFTLASLAKIFPSGLKNIDLKTLK